MANVSVWLPVMLPPTRGRWGISWSRRSRVKFIRCHPIDPEEARRWLVTMADISLSDGRILQSEYQLLCQAGAQLNMNPYDVKQLLRQPGECGLWFSISPEDGGGGVRNGLCIVFGTQAVLEIRIPRLKPGAICHGPFGTKIGRRQHGAHCVTPSVYGRGLGYRSPRVARLRR